MFKEKRERDAEGLCEWEWKKQFREIGGWTFWDLEVNWKCGLKRDVPPALLTEMK